MTLPRLPYRGCAAGALLLFLGIFWASTQTSVLAGTAVTPVKADQPKIELIMFDAIGCPYCELWKEQVGITYPKTSEGRFAPLRVIDISDAVEQGVGPVTYTPTFVITRDGKEVGRLIGYISEDFFWPTLGNILKRHGYTSNISAKNPS